MWTKRWANIDCHATHVLLRVCCAAVLKAGRYWLSSTNQMLQPEPATQICLQNNWCPGGIHPNGDGMKPCNKIAAGLRTKG
jgi:hypothetical protein